jgi:hypothetical protein
LPAERAQRPPSTIKALTGATDIAATTPGEPAGTPGHQGEDAVKLETVVYERNQGWSLDPLPPWDSSHTLVVVFGASSFLKDAEPLRQLIEAYPRSHIVGCSTSGEIIGDCLHDDTLVVAIAQFEATNLADATASVASVAESFGAGRSLAETLLADDLRAVLVMSDGLNVNGSELVRGLNSLLPPQVAVTGGLAGDRDKFQRTWVLANGQPQSGVVSAVGLYGDRVRITHGSRGGWDRFGPERRVTRSKGNVLYELDGKPALQLYKTYLGERAAELPASALLFPLALRAAADDPKMLVRTILSVDESQQSMTFAGDIPEASLAQLMRANFERLIQGASHAAEAARPDDDQGDVLSIAISCVGRRLILGERAEEEIAAVLETMPTGTRQIGFYSYGEISPFASGYCDLHNQTMTLTTIAED